MSSRLRPTARIVWAVLGTMVMVLGSLAGPPMESLASSTGAAKEGPPSFADLADQVRHAVVNISTTQVVKESPMQPFMQPNSPFREFFGDEFFKRFFGDQPQGGMKTHALGSGLIIGEDGLILTNNHVVEKADESRSRPRVTTRITTRRWWAGIRRRISH